MQILAGIIKDMKDIAEVDGSPVTDCVLSVPAYFVESERYAMLNAARIAGVNCLRLLNDTTAIALAYGIYKTDLPDTEAVNVAFVDIGHNAYQVRLFCPLLCVHQLPSSSEGKDRHNGEVARAPSLVEKLLSLPSRDFLLSNLLVWTLLRPSSKNFAL